MMENPDLSEQLAFVQRLAGRYPFVADALTERAAEFAEDELDPPVFMVLSDVALWVERHYVASETLVREFLATVDAAYASGSGPIKGLIAVGMVESLPGIWTRPGDDIVKLAGDNIGRLMRVFAEHGAIFDHDLI